jgi:hypothetical protein
MIELKSLTTCWVCGQPANTGEHKIKKADLSFVFGRAVSLFLHTARKRNERVQGLNSDKLKYQSRLCSYCNSARTQPHDIAWQTLSNYLRLPGRLSAGSTIDLADVFADQWSSSMLNVHLYFLKLFGCRIADGGVPLPLPEFGECIRNGSPHPKVYLAFHAEPNEPVVAVGQTDIGVVREVNGPIVFASWSHYLGSVSVNVTFSEPGQHREGLLDAWHPSHNSCTLRLKQSAQG